MTQGNIYLDFNATTPVHSEVQARLSEWSTFWGNPSSIHRDGRQSKKLLRESRRTLAQALGCHPLELVFTSGGSEANNLAIKGCLGSLKEKGSQRNRVLLGAIEHPSVLKQEHTLKLQGFEVIRIPVDREGQYNMNFFKKYLDDKVALVSVMFANNEVGVIAPLREMVKLTHDVGGYFHSDLVQALGKIPFALKELDVDLASFSSHKVYALKGAGLLYSKKGTPLTSLIQGGAQERGRRAGTENLLAIASFAHMVQFLQEHPLKTSLLNLRDKMEKQIEAKVSGVQFLCRSQERLPNTSSFFISGVSGESLLMNLDIRGFSVGTGAACSSGNPEPSPVLLAMGLSHAEAQSSLRVSLGASTTAQQIDLFVNNLSEVVTHLRELDKVEMSYGQ